MEEDPSSILRAFLSWFENNRGWLLIYDNVEEFETIKRFMPRNKNGDILITTRATQSYMGTRVDVDLFDESEAIAFLQSRTGIDDESNAAQLAKQLGYLPLALDMAAAYIAAVPDMDFDKYLLLLSDQALTVLDEGVSLLGDYGLTIRATWRISLDKIQLKSARQLLNLCAYFAPNDILLSIFTLEAEVLQDYKLSDYRSDERYLELCLPAPLRDELLDQLILNKIIMEITKFSLVKCENNSLQIHRLLQKVIRDELKGDTAIIKQCYCLADQILSMFNREKPNLAGLFCNLPHASSIADFSEELLTPDDDFWQRCFQNIYYRHGMSFELFYEYERALNYYHKALNIYTYLHNIDIEESNFRAPLVPVHLMKHIKDAIKTCEEEIKKMHNEGGRLSDVLF